MNFKTTATLLVLAFLIAAYFFFVERNTPSTLDLEKVQLASDPQEGTPLFTVDELSASSIDHLTIETSNGRIEAARDGLDWYQVQPVRFALDSWLVQPVIDAVTGLRYSRKFLPGEAGKPKLNELGLAPPQSTITFSTSGPKPVKFTVKVGQTGAGGRGYVMLNDNPEVYVVSDALHKTIVDQKPQDWRRHTLPAPQESLTNRIAFIRPGSSADENLAGQFTGPKSFRMVRHGNEWELAGNNVGRVDPDKIKALLDSLTSLHIDKFVVDAPADLAEYGLDKPALTLTLQSTPAPPSIPPGGLESPATRPAATQPAAQKPIVQTLRIGGPVDMSGDAFFATWSDKGEPGNVVFTILKSDRQRLDKSVRDFRDARLTALPMRDIRELTIERGKETLRLERGENGGWSFVAPAPGFPPDYEAVSDLLDSLTILRADSFVPNAKPVGAPIATVRLAAPSPAEPDVLSIYPAPDATGLSSDTDAQDLVMRNHDPTGLLVPADRLAKVLAPAISLRDRLILEVQPAQIRAIKITRTGLPPEDAVVALTRTPAPAASAPPKSPVRPNQAVGGYPAALKIDPSSLDALLNTVAPLRAQDWTVEEKPRSSDLKSIIDLEVTMAGGTTQLIHIYPDSYLGDLPGINAYFRVDKSLVDALEAEFRDRTIIGIDVDDLKQVILTDQPSGRAAGRTVVIVRDSLGGFHCAQIKDLSQANAGALFDTLASLRAERYAKAPTLFSRAPERSLDVEARSGKKIHLVLPTGAPWLNRFACVTLPGGTTRWFKVSDDAAAKLHADMHMPPKIGNLQ